MTERADRLVFVRAAPADADRLAAHERRVADRLYGPALDRNACAREIAGNALYFVEVDGALAATAAWRLRDDGGAYLSNIAVDPDFRRRGVARAATLFLLEQAQGCARVDLVTHPDNAAAIALYRSLGFALESRKDDWFGDGEPRWVMVRDRPMRTPRLLLRPATTFDRGDLHRLEQDPEVMRHLNGGRATPLEPSADERAAAGFLMPRGPEVGLWAAIELASDNLLGWVSLSPDGSTGRLGYRFFRQAWGRGFATEAAEAVVADGFLRLGLGRISAETMSVNLASQRVMQRLGMRRVRTFFVDYPDRLPGGEQGDVEYALLRDAWKGRIAP